MNLIIEIYHGQAAIYAELLSPGARGEAGARAFDDADVQTLCTSAALRREDVPRAEIIARLQRGDVVIETTPSPQQTTPNDGEGQKAGQGDALAVMVVRSDLQRQIDALARTQSTLLRAAVLWGALWGAVAALVFAAFVVWVLWLVVAY